MSMRRITFILLCLVASWTEAQTLQYGRPADYFEEALVIGNGMMGGIVYGKTDTEKISLNDITLWTGEPCNMKVYSPEAHKTIPLIRVALKRRIACKERCKAISRKTTSHWDN